MPFIPQFWLSPTAEDTSFSLLGRIEEIFQQFPERVAVHDSFRSFSYMDLKEESNCLASILETVPDSTPVPILIDHDPRVIKAIIGVLKAGRPYTVIDPSLPISRINQILAMIQNRILLTTADHLKLAWEIIAREDLVIDVDSLPNRREEEPPGNKDFRSQQDFVVEKPAGIFFTSGSTGTPKPLIRTLAAILHRIRLESIDYDIGPADVFSMLYHCSFGATVGDIWKALLNGARLVFFEMKSKGVKELSDWIRQEGITFLHLPSALYRELLRSLAPGDFFPSLRYIIPMGWLYRQDVERTWKHVPDHCRLIQHYSTTESGMVCKMIIDKTTPIQTNMVPVGYTIPGYEISIVDEHEHPVVPGEIGEIVIKSDFTSPGYWGQPDSGSDVFKRDHQGKRIYKSGDLGRMAPDGCLELIGRKDSMVKVRGYRVHLGDIEAALHGLEGISEAAAVVDERFDAKKRLIAYVLPAGNQEPSTEVLRRGLAQTLPNYMIPARFILIPRLPKTSTGKIDQQALPPVTSLRPSLDIPYLPPNTDLEKSLCKLWQELLDLDQVGIQDNFFDLGGDSLLAINLTIQVSELFGADISSEYFRQPTVEQLAMLITSNEAEVNRSITKPSQSTVLHSNLRRSPITRILQVVYNRIKWMKEGRSTREWMRLDLQRLLVAFVESLSYQQTIRLLWHLSRLNFISAVFFQQERNRFYHFCNDLGLPEAGQFEDSLPGNMINRLQEYKINHEFSGQPVSAVKASSRRFWRSAAALIEKSSPDELSRYFTFSGLSQIREPVEKGRGVLLLAYHNANKVFTTLALAKVLACQPIPTVSWEPWRWGFYGDCGLITEEKQIFAQIAVEAQSLLSRGRIVKIVPDVDCLPGEGLPVRWAGRDHFIRPGFAELALNTRAVLIPIFSVMKPGGCIHTTILPPLDPGPETASRDARVQHLLRQYGEFVNRCCRQFPESFLWVILDSYANMAL